MAKGTIWIRKRLTVSTYRAVTDGFMKPGVPPERQSRIEGLLGANVQVVSLCSAHDPLPLSIAP
jgi:hypothetical protein